MRRGLVAVLVLWVCAVPEGHAASWEESVPASKTVRPKESSQPSVSYSHSPRIRASSSAAIHEPALMEGLQFKERHRFDFGMGLNGDAYYPEGVDSETFSVAYLKMSCFLDYRFSPQDRLQFSIRAPFLFQMIATGGTAGALYDDQMSAGMGQFALGGKFAFNSNFGAMAFAELPTGNPEAAPATGEGTNYGASFLAERIYNSAGFHASIGQIMKSEYDLGTGTRDPGDITAISGAVTFRSRSAAVGSFEAHHFIVGQEKLGGTAIDDTNGSITNLVLGVTTVNKKGMVIKAAGIMAVGKEDLQSFDLVRGAGDFGFQITLGSRWGKR